MTRNRNLLLFGIICAAQLAVCGSLIVRWERVLRQGTPYRFLAEPVDPFDAFRGRFVAIRVEQNDLVADGQPYRSGQTVYARLVTNAAGFTQFDQLFPVRPAAEVPYLKTTIGHVDDNSRFREGDILDADLLAGRILASNDTVSAAMRENLQHRELQDLQRETDDPREKNQRRRQLAEILNRLLYDQAFADRLFGRGKSVVLYAEQRRMQRELVQAFPGVLAQPPAARVHLNLPFDRFYMEESLAPRAESAYREHSRVASAERTTITVRILHGQGLIENLWIGEQSIAEYLQSAK